MRRTNYDEERPPMIHTYELRAPMEEWDAIVRELFVTESPLARSLVWTVGNNLELSRRGVFGPIRARGPLQIVSTSKEATDFLVAIAQRAGIEVKGS